MSECSTSATKFTCGTPEVNQKPLVQGRSAMEEDDKRVAGALAAAFRVKLGGSSGKDWGDCLAVGALTNDTHELKCVLHYTSSCQ